MPRFPLVPVLVICLAMVAGCRLGLTSRDPRNGTLGTPLIPRLANREAIAKLLPPDVQLDTVAECGYGSANQITVEEELIRVQAHVGDDGKLHDAAGKPIQFFRLTGCWGNPPGNYQQILDEQNSRLEELRKTHAVITLTCNPSGLPIP
jgi:hypothetical protein